MKKRRLWHSFFARLMKLSFAVLMVSAMFTACGVSMPPAGSGSASNGKVPTAVNQAGEGTKIDEENKKEADMLSAKVRMMEGMGDFGITVYKAKDDVSSFVLRVENKNDFPSAALVECAIRGTDGEI